MTLGCPAGTGSSDGPAVAPAGGSGGALVTVSNTSASSSARTPAIAQSGNAPTRDSRSDPGVPRLELAKLLRNVEYELPFR